MLRPSRLAAHILDAKGDKATLNGYILDSVESRPARISQISISWPLCVVCGGQDQSFVPYCRWIDKLYYCTASWKVHRQGELRYLQTWVGWSARIRLNPGGVEHRLTGSFCLQSTK